MKNPSITLLKKQIKKLEAEDFDLEAAEREYWEVMRETRSLGC